MKCPYCNSSHINKNGIKYNKQRYICRNCNKTISEGTDNRIKRDIKQRELCLLLYSHNMSMRSIQSTINKFYNTNIAIRLIEKWIKSFKKLLELDINNKKEETKETKETEKTERIKEIKEIKEIEEIEKTKRIKETKEIEETERKDRPKTIEVLEMDELYSKYYDYKKNEQKELKYGLLLIENEIKLLHLR